MKQCEGCDSQVKKKKYEVMLVRKLYQTVTVLAHSEVEAVTEALEYGHADYWDDYGQYCEVDSIDNLGEIE